MPNKPRLQASTVVVALGGNAILRRGQRGTVEEQLANLRMMASQIALLVADGFRLVITHGNGPQVGNIHLQQAAGSSEVPPMPLDVCGAMSQGQIGYLIAGTVSEALAERGCARPLVTIVTRTLVDPTDLAFQHPTKPIGPFYGAAAAERLRTEKGWTLTSDSDRGYRRVVPSPLPLSILEADAVSLLLGAGAIPIACGGGGVPVVRDREGFYRGVEAVVDKDLAALLLARQVGARVLVLLTEVAQVCVNYGTPAERRLEDVSLEEMERLEAQGHFPPGSMGPKVRAAMDFIRAGGELAVITSAEQVSASLLGNAGTRIRKGNPVVGSTSSEPPVLAASTQL